jgi:hypothetical protein
MRTAIAAVCLLAAAGVAAAAPVTGGTEEYDIKAVFLFNFTRFVEWPSQVDAQTKPLVIGVLGDDPFAGRLEEAIRGETSGKRAVAARRLSAIDEIGNCDALFICRSEKPHVEKILRELKDRPVLTVSDIPDFAELGGMVELVTEKSKVRLHINVDACKAASLAVSSKLLRPAVIVTTRKSSQFHHPLTANSFAVLEYRAVAPSWAADGSNVTPTD